MEDKAFKFREGKARHLISFKFKSAADMASLKREIKTNNTKQNYRNTEKISRHFRNEKMEQVGGQERSRRKM